MDLKVTIIQSDLYWEDINENLNMFSQKIGAIKEHTDIIVLPEMFNTGFSMQSEKLAENMNGETVNWMKKQSKSKNAVITGSLIIEVEGNYYNRLIWVEPNGKLLTYDKRHLFRMAQEHKSFSAGIKRLIINYKGWRICPLICYDLRFPVWSRNRIDNESPVYDCLIYIANWPETRRLHWIKLLEARAIENQCYVIGVNRIGKDGNNYSYSGDSVVNNFMGEAILSTSQKAESIETINLSKIELNNWREKFPLSIDGDRFEIIH